MQQNDRWLNATDAVFAKHAIDAIVDRRVISQDTAQKVASVKYNACQEAASYSEEGHMITIRVAE